MNKAVFFDRDGTINVDVGYLYEPDKLEFISGVPELIRSFNQKGYLVVAITNQSGIARGLYTEEDMHTLHRVMNERLQSEYAAHIDAFYYCPHLPEITGVCNCRKPSPGLFLRAIRELDIDPKTALSFGDSQRDKEASLAAGIDAFIFIWDAVKKSI